MVVMVVVVVVVVVVVAVTELCSVRPDGWYFLELTHPSTCTPHIEDFGHVSGTVTMLHTCMLQCVVLNIFTSHTHTHTHTHAHTHTHTCTHTHTHINTLILIYSEYNTTEPSIQDTNVKDYLNELLWVYLKY